VLYFSIGAVCGREVSVSVCLRVGGRYPDIVAEGSGRDFFSIVPDAMRDTRTATNEGGMLLLELDVAWGSFFGIFKQDCRLWRLFRGLEVGLQQR
jgi:hypothetical protein